MSYGEYFKQLRVSKKITQKQVADAIGKTPMLVSGVETGKNGPFTQEDMGKIAQIMGLTREERNELDYLSVEYRGRLPGNIKEYILSHKQMYEIIVDLTNRNVSDMELVALKRYAEGIR